MVVYKRVWLRQCHAQDNGVCESVGMYSAVGYEMRGCGKESKCGVRLCH
jgi:hypothetical protein